MAAKMTAEMNDHHKKSSLCASRPKYREARWERAVKVYTINLESKYLLVQGVPALDVTKDLLETFAIYGTIDEYRILDDYPAEEFTKVYWIKFQHIMAARKAKRKLDNRSFFGGILHVSYAPEFESVDETREKLMDRKRIIERKLSCAQKQSNREEKRHHESHSLRNDSSDSTTTCSRIKMTEVPDDHSVASTSSTQTPWVISDEPTEHVDNIDESTYSPFPSRLPPLTVPTYPSQVSTMSISLNTPQTCSNLRDKAATVTAPPQQRLPHHVEAEARPITVSSQKSYGYNSDLRLPARPPHQGKEVSLGPINDNGGNFHAEESLTGDVSLDRTVLSIREKLKNVNKRSILETQEAVSNKKKQRKRI